MPRSPIVLAALATAAVPGLDVLQVGPTNLSLGDDDMALIIDGKSNQWLIRAPRTAASGAALEAELGLVEELARQNDSGAIPFDVLRPAGTVDVPDGGRVVVYPKLRGEPLDIQNLDAGPGLAASLGKALGALHELPTSVIENAGMPVYDADEYRMRRLSELDEAATTGRVPVNLLKRWEASLEDVSWWKFRPTVVHGDLIAEQVLTADNNVTGILGWGDAKVADPADDLAWLYVAAPQSALDSVVEAYTMTRTGGTDPHITDRALLAGELALVRWLLHGVHTDNKDVVDDAVAMLEELDRDIETEGPATES